MQVKRIIQDIERHEKMVYDFTANDVFEMAEQLERNGAKFYGNAAQNTDNPEYKKLLNVLAEMEVEHEKTFVDLRSELSGNEKASTAFDPQNESVLYLKALADTKIFFEKEINFSSMKSVLKAAILAEKDSIVFYLGMKEMVPEKYGKDKLDKIIKEEMGHIKILSKELVALKNP
ncbi:MAG: ferritin family protein [Desulfobacteraceae bacterium]|nr:ferritin family protein [Desulfobacteraceae bacterium]